VKIAKASASSTCKEKVRKQISKEVKKGSNETLESGFEKKNTKLNHL